MSHEDAAVPWQRVAVAGVSLLVPDDWHGGQAPGLVLVAAGPARGGFAPTITVATDDVPPPATLGEWSNSSVEVLRGLLHSYHLLDVLPDEVAGHDALVRLGTYGLDDRSLTVAQWAWLTGATGTTVTATCATADYAGLVDMFSDIVHSYREDDRCSPRP